MPTERATWTHDGRAAVDGVVAALRTDIIEARLSSGTRLPDQQLAERFGVSRNTVRDALRLLSVEGLVSIRHNAGSVVRRLSSDDVRDIYAARRVVESAAILGAGTAADALLQAVERSAGAAELAVVNEAWSQVGTESLAFHQSIVDLAASERLSRFFSTLAAQLRLVFAELQDEAAFQAAWISRDRVIVDHLLAGRRDTAAQELRRYLDDSETMVLDVVRRALRRVA